MRYVGYMRQNPWQGIENTLVIEEQKAVIERYANEHGWTVTEFYVDGNENDDCRKMKEMIHDGIGRNFDGVVVASFPYFAADPSAARQTAYEIFYAAGIRFAVAEDDFDSSRLSSKEVVDYFEQKRRDMVSEQAVKRLSEQDDLMLQRVTTYGYKISEDGMSYVKDEKVSDYVEGIFRQYLAGSKPVDIAHWLNDNGVLNRSAYKQMKSGREPKRNSRWDSLQVTKLMSAKIYTGKDARKYGERIIEVTSEPYITEEEQRIIIERLEREKRKAQKNLSGRENPFKYRIFSAFSGKSMILQEEGFVDKKYVSCIEKTRDAHSIPFQTVMAKVQKQLAEEKRCAVAAENRIRNGDGRAAFLQARAKFSEQMKEVMENMRYFLEKDLHAPELEALDEEAERISKGLKTLEKAFNLKNSWILLFTETEIPEIPDREICQKLIERIDISKDYRDIKVKFKEQEMKKYLPEEWWKEGTD